MSGANQSTLQACGHIGMHPSADGTLYACRGLRYAWWLLVRGCAYLAAHNEVVCPKRMIVLCHAPHPLHQQCHIHQPTHWPSETHYEATNLALDLQLRQSSHERRREPAPCHQCGS